MLRLALSAFITAERFRSALVDAANEIYILLVVFHVQIEYLQLLGYDMIGALDMRLYVDNTSNGRQKARRSTLVARRGVVCNIHSITLREMGRDRTVTPAEATYATINRTNVFNPGLYVASSTSII